MAKAGCEVKPRTGRKRIKKLSDSILNQPLMKKIYHILFIVAFTGIYSAFAQTTPSWQWVKQAGGASTDNVASSAIDNQGNVYVTGTYYSTTMAFGAQTITNSGPGGDFNTRDIYFAKYDANGNLVWVKNIGTPLHDDVLAIATDNQGNIYLGGSYQSESIAFGNFTLTNSSNKTDLYLVKYNSDGNALWAKSAMGTMYETVRTLKTDTEGNIYMGGLFNSATLDFGNNVIANLTPGTSDQDVYLVKLNSEGIAQWVRYAGGNTYDDVMDVTLDAQGNVYMTGYFYSTQITFGTTTLTNTNVYGDIYIVKYNSNGTVVWAKRQGGDNYDVPNAIVHDNNGHFYIGGYFQSASIAIGGTTLTNSGTYFDFFIAKYNDSDGTPVWAKTASGPRSDSVKDLVLDSEGSIYALGSFGGFGTGTSSITFPGMGTITSQGGSDMFFVKYNTDGILQWLKTAGGTEADFGVSAVINSQNNIYTVGTLGSSAVNFDSAQASSAGYEDLFIARLDTGVLAAAGFEPTKATVYPNPVKNTLNISGKDINKSQYTVIDTLGRNIQSGTITNNTISTANLPAGLYILSSNSITTKFVKE